MNSWTDTTANKTIQDEFTENIWKIIPPVFIIIGSIGNLISIVVLIRPNIIKSSSALYLIVLALSDTLVLYTGLMRHWIEHAFKWNVRHHSEAGCKVHVFMTYFSLDFSAWLLVAVTLDRLVTVWFPYTAKRKCTKSTGLLIISAICIVLVAVNVHLIYGHAQIINIENNSTKIDLCDYVDERYKTFFINTWPWVDLAIFCIVPFCFLLIGNLLICLKLLSWQRATKRRKITRKSGCYKSPMSSITLMLFTVNTVFLICTTPISIFNINDRNHSALTEAQRVDHDLQWSVCNILMYANNTFNFLLYIFSGSRFRNEAKFLISECVGRKKSGSPLELRLPNADKNIKNCN